MAKKKKDKKDLSRFFALSKGEKISTGVLSLDIVLGEGGVDKGDLIELSSDSGVGKSTVLLHVVADMLGRGYKCAYLDVERGVKEDILSNFGLEGKESDQVGDPFLLLSPTTFAHAEEILDSILDTEEPYDMIVIDSFTGLLPTAKKDESVEDMQPAQFARTSSLFLQKYKPLLREYGAICWLISQLRYKLNFLGRTQTQSAGGEALKFYPDIRLRMRHGTYRKRKELTVKGIEDVIYGDNAFIHAIKNRTERSHIDVDIPVIFGRGVSNNVTLRNILSNHDLIKVSGGYFKVHWEGEDLSFHGEKALIQWIKENYEILTNYAEEQGWLVLTSGECD